MHPYDQMLAAELVAIAEEMEAELTEDVLTVDWVERIRAVAFTVEGACPTCQGMGTTWNRETGDAEVCHCAAGDQKAEAFPWMRRTTA